MLKLCFAYVPPPVLPRPRIFGPPPDGQDPLLCGGLPTKQAGVADNAEAVFSQRRKLELDFGRGVRGRRGRRGGKE